MKKRFIAFPMFLVTDLNGDAFCDTTDDHEPINVASRPYFTRVLTTSAFTVGEYSIGLAIRERSIVFALPFYQVNGHMGGIILAPLGLDWLADHIARRGIPAGAEIALTDRNGTYLARYPDNERFVGTTMRGKKALQIDAQGAVDTLNIDGVERIVGYSTLGADSGGLVVSYSLEARAFAAIQNRTYLGILLIVANISLVLVFTWLAAWRFIDRPLGQLVSAVNQRRPGDFSPRAGHPEKLRDRPDR
jgi:hypothetical protein